MTDYLTIDDLLAVVVRATGREPLVRDVGLLEAALARPRASVFGEDAYGDVWTKAAALLHSLVRSHPLVDGNKRVGWLTAIVFLHINGVPVVIDWLEAADLALSVAEGELDDVDKIAERLRLLARG